MSDIVEDLRYAEHVIDERVMKVMDAGADEIESLRQQLAEKHVEVKRLKQSHLEEMSAVQIRLAENKDQLAASQAREQQLREICNKLSPFGSAYMPHSKRIKLIDTLNSIPSDTTALSAMISKAGEVMRERCAKHLESCAQSFAEEYGHDDLGCLSFGSGAAAELRMDTFNGWMEDADAIRALPAVTLDDMKGGA